MYSENPPAAARGSWSVRCKADSGGGVGVARVVRRALNAMRMDHTSCFLLESGMVRF